MIMMQKSWNKNETHNMFLKVHSKTIQTFHQMVSINELPTSVVAQYIPAVNYTNKRRIEILAQGGITQDVLNLDNIDDDERDHFLAWLHHNHMTDNRKISYYIDNLNVDIGLDHDWCKIPSNVERNLSNEPEKWIQYAVNECDKLNNKEVTNKEDLKVPKK